MKGCDTFLMIGSAFPYSEFLPKPGEARGVQIDIDGAHAQPALPDGGQPRRRQRGDACARCCRCSKQKPDGKLARRDRGRTWPTWWKTLRRARDAVRRPDQPAARLLGTVAAPARELHHHRRLRLRRQLVCARHQDAPRHEGLALRRPRLARRRDAVRARRPRWRIPSGP